MPRFDRTCCGSGNNASSSMGSSKVQRWRLAVALFPIIAGVGLHLYEHVALSDNGFSPEFFLWSVMPYGLCLAGLALSWNPLSVGFAVTGALTFDLLAHYSVFVHPTSSTAALVLLFMPIYNAILWIPAAMLLAHLAQRWFANSTRHP